MNKDNLFKQKRLAVSAFQFDAEVADVFDDMVSRSVPFYHEIHGVVMDMLERAYPPKTTIYDLGCSTGTTMVQMDHHLKKINLPRGRFVGVDNSAPMLEKCQAKLDAAQVENIELKLQDLESFIFESPAGLVIMNYTLQFLNPEGRQKLLRDIYQALVPGGVFILAEKIKSEDHLLQDLTTDLYYDFKRRNGYSELEISQKREALENVLIPMTPDEQLQALKMAGFAHSEMIFRWYNFAVTLGIKK